MASDALRYSDRFTKVWEFPEGLVHQFFLLNERGIYTATLPQQVYAEKSAALRNREDPVAVCGPLLNKAVRHEAVTRVILRPKRDYLFVQHSLARSDDEDSEYLLPIRDAEQGEEILTALEDLYGERKSEPDYNSKEIVGWAAWCIALLLLGGICTYDAYDYGRMTEEQIRDSAPSRILARLIWTFSVYILAPLGWPFVASFASILVLLAFAMFLSSLFPPPRQVLFPSRRA